MNIIDHIRGKIKISGVMSVLNILAIVPISFGKNSINKND